MPNECWPSDVHSHINIVGDANRHERRPIILLLLLVLVLRAIYGGAAVATEPYKKKQLDDSYQIPISFSFPFSIPIPNAAAGDFWQLEAPSRSLDSEINTSNVYTITILYTAGRALSVNILIRNCMRNPSRVYRSEMMYHNQQNPATNPTGPMPKPPVRGRFLRGSFSFPFSSFRSCAPFLVCPPLPDVSLRMVRQSHQPLYRAYG